jgi:hypothetical protein
MTEIVMRADGVASAHDHARAPARRTPLRRKDAAQYIREVHGQPCSHKTLSKYAVTGDGPAYRKAGRFPLYAPDDLDEWATAKLSAKVRSSSELRGLQSDTRRQPAEVAAESTQPTDSNSQEHTTLEDEGSPSC